MIMTFSVAKRGWGKRNIPLRSYSQRWSTPLFIRMCCALFPKKKRKHVDVCRMMPLISPINFVLQHDFRLFRRSRTIVSHAKMNAPRQKRERNNHTICTTIPFAFLSVQSDVGSHCPSPLLPGSASTIFPYVHEHVNFHAVVLVGSGLNGMHTARGPQT